MSYTQLVQKPDELTPPPSLSVDSTLFSLTELASYDLSDSKKSQYGDQIPSIFLQFLNEYKKVFEKRKEEFSRLINSSQNKEDLQEIRKNIKILIIIGSSINYQESDYFDGTCEKGSEDLSIALLIRHLFHYKFGIPYDDILITSTQNSNFSLIGFDEQLISTPNNIFKEFKDSDPTENQIDKIDFKIKTKNKKEFLFYQNINLTQIKDQQYKFFLDKNINDIVKPFNINIINKKIKSDDESFIYSFLIDHKNSNGFGNIPYQFIIERLNEIQCKHFFLFNDSNKSGSIIKLIESSKGFIDIFPDIKEPTLESALFYFITNLDKVYSSDEQIKINIFENLHLIDSYDIDSEIMNKVKSKLIELDKSKLNKISEFILNLGNEFQSKGCVPQHFIKFSEKATIFTSSMFDQISLTLPCRKYIISAIGEPNIRIFGSIFSSIVIESFLNEKALFSLDTFVEFISDQFNVYKNLFIKLITLQNRSPDNSIIYKDTEINSFFTPESFLKTHYCTQSNVWPNLTSIILSKDSWNVDISKVDSNEYNDVHFFMFKDDNEIAFKSLSNEQLSNYDIPNAKSNHYNHETIKLIFNQFKTQYQASFCNRARIANNKARIANNKALSEINKTSSLEAKNKNDKKRSISILIIIGSSITIQNSQYHEADYYKDAEDLNTALLIRHLFRYAFGIPKKQILITSTQNSDFKTRVIHNNIPKTEIDSDIYFNIIKENEFLLHQQINLAQVGNMQYKFYLDENLKYIIKPFNINIINKELSINDDNSDLFVFFLDHSLAGGFSTLQYQLIIENLLKIKCKHFFVFNDSCYSGSLIKLIEICTKFREIFPEISNSPFESVLYRLLMNLDKISKDNIKSIIRKEIKSIKQKEINYIESKINNPVSLDKIIKLFR